MHKLFLQALGAGALLGSALYADATCSPYVGQASINEVSKFRSNGADDPEDFVEIKLLDASIPSSTYLSWSIRICENSSDGCSPSISVSSFTNTTPPWLVVKGSTLPGAYISFDDGFDILFSDQNGDTIDYLTYDGYAVQKDNTCFDELLFDTAEGTTGGGEKRIRRNPDGTGDWTFVTAQSDGDTEDTTNDDVPSNAPTLTIADTTVAPGSSAIFTVSIDSSYDQVVNFSYQTLDGSALAGSDYTASSGSASIAIGDTSVTLSVPTSSSALDGEYFYVLLGGFDNVIVTDQVGQATFASPALAAPVAEYRMEDGSWSGSANEVNDSSGNGLNGSAIAVSGGPLATVDSTGPAISGNPGTCDYGVFDGSADGYLEIADPGSGSLLDTDASFTIATWINANSWPASDLATIAAKNSNWSLHLNSSGQVHWLWNSASFTTGAAITPGGWHHLALSYRDGEQLIYIDGALAASNSASGSPANSDDPLLIGSDFSATSRRFDGLIDELKIYDATLSASQVATVMAETHACTGPPLDHFYLFHAGTGNPGYSGVSCEAEAVSVAAHTSADAAASVAGTTITVSATSTTAGWSANDASWSLASGAGSFSVTGPGTAQYTFATGESSVGLLLANTSLATIDIDVVDGSGSYSDLDGDASEDAPLAFSDTGLRFYTAEGDNDGDGDSDVVNNLPISSPLTAGQASGELILRAVRSNSDTGACEAVLDSQTLAIDMAYECLNPSTCVRNRDMNIGATAIEENAFASVVDFAPVNFSFDDDGEATFTMNYFDVGVVRLHASASLPASGGNPALTLSGTSGSTTVAPADFAITLVESNDAPAVANPGTTIGAPGFVPAGTPFRVVVEARNAVGGLTPNYGNESAAESITLAVASLVMPAGGSSAGFSPGAFAATATGGEFASSTAAWSDVGTITLSASVADGDYLGTGNVSGSPSGNVGRFYPDHLRLFSSSAAPSCGSFAYMSDQLFSLRPIDTALVVNAENTGNAIVSNYRSDLGYPTESFNLVAENANDGGELSSRASLQNLGATGWALGQFSLAGTGNGGLRRNLSGLLEQPDGPFASLQLGLKVAGNDPDGLNFRSADLTMLASAANDCVVDGNCDAAAIGASLDLRFGRLRIAGAVGPETSDLAVNFVSEYWNGSDFVLNSADSCTALSANDIYFAGSAISGGTSVAVGAGTSNGSFTSFGLGLMTFSGGDAGLVFSAPGAGNRGSFDVDIDLASYPWLRSDWNQNGDAADDSALPSAQIYFGGYRGHDRVIYWKEVF